MEQKFIEMSKVIFTSIDHYRESGRDDKFNIDSIAEYLQRQFLLQQTPCTTLLPDSKDEYRLLVDGQQLMLGSYDECKRFAGELSNADKRKVIIVATVWRQ